MHFTIVLQRFEVFAQAIRYPPHLRLPAFFQKLPVSEKRTGRFWGEFLNTWYGPPHLEIAEVGPFIIGKGIRRKANLKV